MMNTKLKWETPELANLNKKVTHGDCWVVGFSNLGGGADCFTGPSATTGVCWDGNSASSQCDVGSSHV